MGIHVSWDDHAHTIVRFDFDYPWNQDDINDAMANIDAMCGDDCCDVILNKLGSVIPQWAIPHLNHLITHMPHDGLVIIAENHTYSRSTLNMFTQWHDYFGDRLKMTSSIEQARDVIEDYRQILAEQVS
jgi:hypothetical protein